MKQKDYNLLARAVACPSCHTKAGERCFGSYAQYVGYTHFQRRALAAQARHVIRKRQA